MSDPVLQTTGEFAGWSYWPGDAFESTAGPFYYRRDDAGVAHCAFRAEPRHLNGQGAVHGGCFLTFADFCLFSIAQPLLNGVFVTINLTGDFTGPGFAGDLIEGTGEIVRAGGRLIFIRGTTTANGRPAHSFSGIISRVSRPPLASADAPKPA